ncbi:MAG TPA: TIGR03857 family LLM class F420-dependent oxidoreductase [Acidimicrobiales bacterium]|nr:TIGR03857 family LLM class F420-dependent oxidoreductase [Acidimicrobiales bacterium]
MSPRTPALLGAYVLPGPAMDPTVCVAQTTEAERLGLGSVWLSELQGPLKDAGALCGYMGHATSTIGFGTSITHFGTRHPMALASWGATMQVLTGGRFLFGFGRSTARRWRQWGVPEPTLRSMADSADILRRLWNHEPVSYSGPAGDFPELDWGHFPDVTPPPLLLAAIGPKTLELGGSHFDGVFLHPFLSPEGVERSVALVRAGAERAGKDPVSVTVYHELVVAPDMSDAEVDAAVRARAAAYFSGAGYGELILRANGWDAEPLGPFREAVRQATADNEAAGSPLKGREVLVEPSRLLPDRFFAEGAAVGSAKDCARRIHDFLDAGADQLIVHGVTPDALGPTVAAFAPEAGKEGK